MSTRDEGPVYYREIQKNAYLTRIPNDVSGGKLRPLGSKKVPNKPMWTQFCVHNGRTPYLEQYPEADSGAALAHKPVWRACLRGARHITASVKPQRGDQYDFLIDTDNGAVRMLAPDWESMQDWVSTLRNTLHELKIVSRGENVYCAGPAPPPPPPPPRAAARDPTSPLPPTPPTPPDRVPGIELTPNIRTTQPQDTTARPQETTNTEPEVIPTLEDENIDISNWEPFTSLPSTSQTTKSEPKKNLAKICGQNICLDDSIFKRTSDGTDSDDEFFADIDKESIFDFENGFKQRLLVSDEKIESTNEGNSSIQATNITVIQVSNKEPPHSAIPILGPETDIFDFDFKQNLTINEAANPSFINIVNTENNDYGTTFSKESNYGHLSLTTTVSLNGPTNPTGPTNEEMYERLCLASTSKAKPSPKAVKKVKNVDKNRKSSLPNLDVNDTTYEYLFLSNNNTNVTNLGGNTSDLANNLANAANSLTNLETNQRCLVNLSNNSGITNTSLSNSPSLSNPSNLPSNSRNLSNNSSNSTNNSINVSNNTNNLLNNSRNVPNNSSNLSNNISNLANTRSGSNNSSNLLNNSRNLPNNSNNLSNNTSNLANEVNSNGDTHSVQISSTTIDPISRVRSVERSRSQNEYDASPRARERENLIRRVQDNSPKRDTKNDRAEQPQPKPIWRRGLTELSILTRIRSIGQVKRQESPTRNDNDNQDRSPAVTSPVQVVHRSRPEGRVDSARRRSSSLSNGAPPPGPALQPLRARQAGELRAEQRRGAALVADVPTRHPPPVFADYNKQVWVSRWGAGGARWGGRAGDRVCAVRGVPPKDAAHAAQLLHAARGPIVDILFHRVPLGNIYVINKREQDSLGIKLDSECNISNVSVESAAGRAGLPPPGRWAVTEVNNRPINIVKGGEEDMNRLSMHGSEVMILIQPTPLVKKLRAALKANKTLLGLR